MKPAIQGALWTALICMSSCLGWAQKTYPASGLVLKVDTAHRMLVVSCDSIPGLMDAMVMPLPVKDRKELDGVAPGDMVTFTLAVDEKSTYAEKIRIHGFQSVEQDPLTARRLQLLSGMPGAAKAPEALKPGERVPDFTLTDQSRQRIEFSRFSGKIVLLNFIYTRCALPNYCYRLSNNFGLVQRRFQSLLGKDLVLLTISFDPVHDTPEVLAHYASIWHADPRGWHFLTGDPTKIQHICGLFGVNSFPDDGLMTHSLHTAIVDRTGKLAANLEGNQFSARQLGDLVATMLKPQR